MIKYIIYFWLAIIIILGSELGGYFWHNLVHNDNASSLYETHKIHHEADLTHEAHEDFLWVILILSIFGMFLFIIYYYLPYLMIYLIVGYIIAFSVFTWNWYVHSAYHIPNHWLNKYAWFRTDKKIHLQHHVNPWKNYGIASHFSDVIFGTYEYPLEDPVLVFNRLKNNNIIQSE